MLKPVYTIGKMSVNVSLYVTCTTGVTVTERQMRRERVLEPVYTIGKMSVNVSLYVTCTTGVTVT